MAAPAFSLGTVSVVAQVSGVPGATNPFNLQEFNLAAPAWSSANAYVVDDTVNDVGIPYRCTATRSATATHPASDASHWTALAVSAYAAPTYLDNTRVYDAFAADLGFSWDDGNGAVLTAFGDTFGFNWSGAGTAGGGGNVNRTWQGGTLDLTTLSNSTVTLSSTTSALNVAPKILAILLTSGDFAYISFTGTSGSTLTGCNFICGTGAGGWTAHNGDDVNGDEVGWAGLSLQTDYGWRSNSLARSTDTNLSDGYTFTHMRPVSSAHTAVEFIPSDHDSNSDATVFSTTLTYTNIVVSGGVCTVTATAHGMVQGQWFELGVGTVFTAGGEWNVRTVVDANTFTFWAFVGNGTETTSTFKKAVNAKTARPLNAQPEQSKIPSGGICVGSRQYVFWWSVVEFTDEMWFTNCMGISYSDDDGVTWTLASTDTALSATDNGGDITTIASWSGAHTAGQLHLVSGGASVVNPSSGAGSVEVDTSTGTALIAYTGRSGTSILTGCTLVQGTGTVATSGGVRSAMWGNNASFTSCHQQGWPWRPGDGYVYVMTTPGGRHPVALSLVGGARMMRVPEEQILDIAAWRYYTGLDGNGDPTWSADRTAATNIFPDTKPVGEPSFYYHPGTGLYVSCYAQRLVAFFESTPSSIVLRTAPNPWGPWSDPLTVIQNASFGRGDLYGGFIHPWSNVGGAASPTGPTGTVTTSISSGSQDQNDFYFHISLFGPYATYLMRAKLYRVKASQTFGRQAVARASRW